MVRKPPSEGCLLLSVQRVRRANDTVKLLDAALVSADLEKKEKTSLATTRESGTLKLTVKARNYRMIQIAGQK